MKGIIKIGRNLRENQEFIQHLAVLGALDFDTISVKQMEAFLVTLGRITADDLARREFANDCPYDLHETGNS